jgi:hypothetical protein
VTERRMRCAGCSDKNNSSNFVEQAMAVKGESGFVRVFLAIALSFPGSAAAQNPTDNTENRPASQNAPSRAVDQHSSVLLKTNNEDDFHRRVETRWKAARKGQIQVYVIPNTKDAEEYEIRIVVTRAPSGSDGTTAVYPPGKASWETLLKLDDELRVRLTSESASGPTIEPLVRGSSAIIQHLDPGGHAEWIWNVRKKAQGGNRLRLQADVVYRRDFSPAGQPVVIYPGADTIISLPDRPTDSPANPQTLAHQR